MYIHITLNQMKRSLLKTCFISFEYFNFMRIASGKKIFLRSWPSLVRMDTKIKFPLCVCQRYFVGKKQKQFTLLTDCCESQEDPFA